MKWQWKLGRFAGIDVFIHATFVLLIGWVGYNYWLQTGELSRVFCWHSLYLCAVRVRDPARVWARADRPQVWHSHARYYDLPDRGVARLERMPDHPLEELWVALAGPAVNLVIAAILIAYLF